MNDFITWWQSIILGVIQGLTEYLPVSSSGHLAITQLMFGLHLPLSFDILLHFATLIPTVWIFRVRIGSLLRSLCQIVLALCKPNGALREMNDKNGKNRTALLRPELKSDGRYILLVLIVTAATFVVAFPQKDLNLKFQPMVIGFAFGVTGLLLCAQQFLLGRRRKRQQKSAVQKSALQQSVLKNALKDEGAQEEQEQEAVTLTDFPWSRALLFAFCIGIAQGIAALPGISRSGITISVALLLGLKRREAGEFSFIISIPVIVGALILDSHELLGIMAIVQGSGFFALLPVLLGFVAACVSGFLALNLLLRLLKNGKLYIFSVYLFVLAFFTLHYAFKAAFGA